jgi:SulP family sulfate permease
MRSLERMVVGLPINEIDKDLVDYAMMLVQQGIVKHLDFVHVLATDGVDDIPSRVEFVRHSMQSSVERRQANLSSSPEITYHVLVGVREDQLCSYLELNKDFGVILLGHRESHSSGKRSLARRLAMISPASVWIVPQNSPPRISHVLAPVDFSSHSADSISVATGIAQKVDLKRCDGLHVFYDPSVFRYEDHNSIQKNELKETFAEFMRPLNTHDVAVEQILEEGSNFAKTAIRVCKERGHDLIVISTRGRSPAASILLGSETSQIIMESQVPVLAVKHRGAKMQLFQVLTSDELWLNKDKGVHE